MAPACRLLNRIYSASDAPAQLRQRRQQLLHAPVRGVPVYVMLPLDTVWLIERDGRTHPALIREKAMEVGLEALQAAGVEGVMVRLPATPPYAAIYQCCESRSSALCLIVGSRVPTGARQGWCCRLRFCSCARCCRHTAFRVLSSVPAAAARLCAGGRMVGHR